MAQPDELEARVAALETQVRELSERVRHSQHDAAAARVLAGGADRDVTEIRAEIRDFRQATTSSFNVMSGDLSDLREDLVGVKKEVADGFRRADAEFRKADDGFTGIRGRLADAAAGQQQIVELLNTLIDQQGGMPGGR
jgi:chromosome segregation ATPase